MPSSFPRTPGNQSRRFPPSHLCRRRGRFQSPPPIIGGGRGWQEIRTESWARRRDSLHKIRVPPPLRGLEDGIQDRSYRGWGSEGGSGSLKVGIGIVLPSKSRGPVPARSFNVLLRASPLRHRFNAIRNGMLPIQDRRDERLIRYLHRGRALIRWNLIFRLRLI